MSESGDEKRPRPGMRDVRLILNDGTEIEVPDGRAALTTPRPEAEPAPVIPEVRFEMTFALTSEQAAWLRYVLVVRRMLYEPLEYRLN